MEDVVICSPKYKCYLWLLIMLPSSMLIGCRYGKTRDTVLVSIANANHSSRATVLRREYLLDNGMADASPTTYVLVSKDNGTPSYQYDQTFDPNQVVMRPSQCGPLKLEWTDDLTLEIICEKCGLGLNALGNNAAKVGPTRIVYKDFPQKSFWE